jgi:predicted dehydrogenase
VYIGTPPVHHKELSVAAHGHGLAVLCEKPLAVSLADGSGMLAAAQASNRPGAVNFALSNGNAVLEIERALGAGQLGEVTGVEIRLRFPVWPRDFQSGATWVAYREQGGFIREVFSHFAYVTDRLLGPMTVESADMTYPAGEPEAAESRATALLHAGGVPVEVDGASGGDEPESYDWIIRGSERSYRLYDWDQLFVSSGDGWAPVELTTPPSGGRARLGLFARAVRGEAVRDLADYASGLRVQRVVEGFHAYGLRDG